MCVSADVMGDDTGKARQQSCVKPPLQSSLNQLETRQTGLADNSLLLFT